MNLLRDPEVQCILADECNADCQHRHPHAPNPMCEHNSRCKGDSIPAICDVVGAE